MFFPFTFRKHSSIMTTVRALSFAAPVGNLLRREPFHAVPAKPPMALPSLPAFSIEYQD
jgi:hypothetical protein